VSQANFNEITMIRKFA